MHSKILRRSFLFFFVTVLPATFLKCSAQDTLVTNRTQNPISFGIGAGLEFGGAGINFAIYPEKHIGAFAGFGYALAGIGYNVGLKARIIGNNKPANTIPFIVGMYGYNAAIAVLNQPDYDKFFYGPSFGAGCEFYSKHRNNGCFTLALLIPVRKPDASDYMDQLKQQGVTFNNTLLPIAISVGYKFL